MLESVWSVGFEDSSVSGLTGSVAGSEDGELKSVFSEQVGSWSSDFVFCVKHDCSDDGNGVWWCSVVTSHFLVQLTHGAVQVGVSVLFIHVMNSGSGLIFQDDSEGFNMVWSFFEDFVNWKNLTLSALGLE